MTAVTEALVQCGGGGNGMSGLYLQRERATTQLGGEEGGGHGALAGGVDWVEA